MMYGDRDYYPGDKSTDDLHSYGEHPDDRAIDKLAARAKIISPEQFAAPVGRNGNFGTGYTASRITSAPNAVSRSAEEASDRRGGDAANLAADKIQNARAKK